MKLSTILPICMLGAVEADMLELSQSYSWAERAELSITSPLGQWNHFHLSGVEQRGYRSGSLTDPQGGDSQFSNGGDSFGSSDDDPLSGFGDDDDLDLDFGGLDTGDTDDMGSSSSEDSFDLGGLDDAMDLSQDSQITGAAQRQPRELKSNVDNIVELSDDVLDPEPLENLVLIHKDSMTLRANPTTSPDTWLITVDSPITLRNFIETLEEQDLVRFQLSQRISDALDTVFHVDSKRITVSTFLNWVADRYQVSAEFSLNNISL